MKIGELAKKTGLTASRIRFYEDIGLLKPVQRTANGYRFYPPETEMLLNLITNGQKAGFSLDELRKLLPTQMDNWQHDQLVAALQQKLADIAVLEQKLADNKRQLQGILAEIATKPDNLNCAENARRVLSQLGLNPFVAVKRSRS